MSIGISFMTANYVARELGFRMTRGWGQGDRAANEHYRPIETYRERLDDLFGRVRALGFDAVDIWEAHLNAAWATDEHIEIARDLLARHELRVASLAGWFGSTPEELEATCRLAVALGRPVLGGGTSVLDKDPSALVDALERHDLRFGLENHPEKSSAETLGRIGGLGPRVGATVDTGWYGTQGYDAAQAIEELGDRVFHVHLKDVREAGQHRCCSYGEGVVPLRACVDALRRIGYTDTISIENEPEDRDPTPEIAASAALLRGWLASAGVAA